MRFIPTRIHGVLDYLYSALLLAAPWLFGFADGGALQWLSMLGGAGTLIMSLLTDYEFSLRRWIYCLRTWRSTWWRGWACSVRPIWWVIHTGTG
jgi:hypothetical protein